jgi:trans-aconitate methyltransferase
VLTRERALYWLDRWDRQQEFYLPDREDRFTAIGDVIEEIVERPDPLIVDLGVGPGSLAWRLLDRIPAASIVGVDADPLLMGLAERAYLDDRFRLVNADLRSGDWYERLGLDRAPDAFVSTTALHWMDRAPLSALIATCASALTPGGVFVNGDHLYEGPEGERLDELARALTARRKQRAGVTGHEDWATWWEAVETAPELSELVTARNSGFAHAVDDRPSAHDYVRYLRESGFAEAGFVWQVGDDRIVVGIR